MVQKRVLCANSDFTASGELRIIQPYTNLKIEGAEFTISHDIERVHDYDAVLIQRPTLPFIPEHLKDYKGVFIAESDDDIFNVPPSNPHHKFYLQARDVYRRCLQRVDYIHVSTPELKKSIYYSDKAEVFLNAIDLNKYGFDYEQARSELRIKYKIPNWQSVVMWTGSPTHSDSLDLIKPVIKELINNDVIVVLCSNLGWLQSQFTQHPNLVLLGWMPFSESIRMPLMADIFLTPLPNNIFNSSKSELKILEAAVLKVPCVSSNVAPYNRFNHISNGGNYLIRKERMKHWLDAIDYLLRDADLHKTMAEKSYNAVRDFYSLDKINEQRAEFWKRVLTL